MTAHDSENDYFRKKRLEIDCANTWIIIVSFFSLKTWQRLGRSLQCDRVVQMESTISQKYLRKRKIDTEKSASFGLHLLASLKSKIKMFQFVRCKWKIFKYWENWMRCTSPMVGKHRTRKRFTDSSFAHWCCVNICIRFTFAIVIGWIVNLHQKCGQSLCRCCNCWYGNARIPFRLWFIYERLNCMDFRSFICGVFA